MFEPLGTQIRLRRKELGMTIDGLAVGAKVSRARLIALEKGDDNVTLDLLVRIANALGLTELYIGGLRLEATAPDLRNAMKMASALRDADELLEKAVEAREQFRRLIVPLAEVVASVTEEDPDGVGERKAASEGE